LKPIVKKEEERFISKNIGVSMKILTDTKTGVQYLHYLCGYQGCLTVLLDTDGKPLVDNSYKTKEEE